MRVLIDATSVLLRSAGVKNYTYYWIQRLRRHAGGDEILAFPYLGRLNQLTHQRSVLNPLQTYARLALLYFINAPGNPALGWMTANADIFHVSNQVRAAPGGGRGRPRITATIHDLTCWLMPELHTAANVRADRNFAERVLKRADRLIAVSENTRADAVRLLGLPEERIEVIYSGVPEAFFEAHPKPAGRPYVLFVGTIEPRKNIDALLDAWVSLKLEGDFDLVVAGPAGWSSEATLARLASGEGGVRYLGYVPEHELPALTAGAIAFVYPSLYEGFGFPVAQAMAAGVPVIASNNSCLPEIAGEGALLVDPRSPREIAWAIASALGSPALRAQLAAAGKARAERYRWDECARRSLEFFRRAL